MKNKQLLSFFILAWFGLFSCTGNSSDEEQQSTDEVSDEGTDFINRLDVALAEKEKWTTHWSEYLGGFSAIDFELASEDSLDQYEMPEKNPIGDDDPLAPYQIPHPGGNGVVDIYSYKIETQDDEGNPYLNPDSEVVWYKADGMKKRLLFIGPSGLFEEAMWLNENELLIMGFFQEEAGARPMIWLLDMETLRMRQYSLDEASDSYPVNSYLDLKIKPLSLD
ncbi:hypothetical protein [Algoriphagus hitonicola]|uniref:Uncharacterized protein n=1 Tax=Algoriphagus hitonicola TaxID=435880 RepID=A0A1I2TNH7_9BACT|nr:hypothetical protein [Algoriphagus hitonicola]SFG66464.1 hypothetical protein SAMN04487988_106125 [Algoriphagus hitonicola]